MTRHALSAALAFALLAGPAMAQNISAATLLKLAAKGRATPSPLSCCDWGGSCVVHKPSG